MVPRRGFSFIRLVAFATTLAPLLAVPAAVVHATDSPSPRPLLIQGIQVFDPATGRMSEPTDILVRGETIESVGAVPPPLEATVMDGSGRYAVPGLFDCHTHLSHLTKQKGDTLAVALRRFVMNGITSVRDVAGPLETLRRMRARIDSGEIEGPEIYYSGPMLERSPLTWESMNAEEPGFTIAVDTEGVADSLLTLFAAGGVRCIKVFGKFDRGVFAHLVARANQLGLPVVHDPGLPLFHEVPVDVSIADGVRSLEHAKAPWPVVLRDDLKREHDELLRSGATDMAKMPFVLKVASLAVEGISDERVDSLAAEMIRRGVYLCPTLHVFPALLADTASMPPPMRTVLGGMEEVSRHIVERMARAGVSIMVGQDGNDPDATLAEMRLLRECGVSEVEILRGATIHPARFLGIYDRIGSIAPGMEADIVILDEDPLQDIGNVGSVRAVVQKGHPIGKT